ncbi:MAG: adenylosuccinate lyase [Thermotogae bacterium]|nr:adenylosuccinate lyase [Thermotogota bacterium]
MISPLDDRYSQLLEKETTLFGERALFQKRVTVEMAYLKALCEVLGIKEKIKEIDVNEKAFAEMKAYERKTMHDVKAVELFVRNRVNRELTPYVHFGLTSEDINSVAYSLTFKEYNETIYLPLLEEVLDDLKKLVEDYKATPMLSRTHGQRAVPTTFGKEIAVFIYRISETFQRLKHFVFKTKFGSTVGIFNALRFTFPQIDWQEFADRFVSSFGLHRNKITTQIDNLDYISEYLDDVRRINNCLLDLVKDAWLYTSLDYLKIKKISKTQVGSSIMPHKLNPIEFENAEGNLEIANALLRFLSDDLLHSRMQRDLSGSTVRRNIGVALSHSTLAMRMLKKGLAKISVNEERLKEELERHYEVLAEAIQTEMRCEGKTEAYEEMRNTFQNIVEMDRDTYIKKIEKLDISDEGKKKLIRLKPADYIGYAVEMADEVIEFKNNKEGR